jgi:hypothetical protein
MGPDLGGLIGWQTIKDFPCHPSPAMGAVEGVLAIQFRPIMAVLAR